MRKALAAAALSAAIATLGFHHHGATWAADTANAPGQKADAPAQAQVPVKQVVLFSSGVGYFEHFGSVHGAGTTELQFKSVQINDILKSLVMEDLDGGRVTAVNYPSQDPIAKTLRSFEIDITANPAMHDLLEQLRGARVTVTAGAEHLSGTVLGVEKKQRAVGDKSQLVDVWYLNLISGDGGGTIRSIAMDEVRNLVLDDPRLRDELSKALAALASSRDQDKKPVSIRFTGEGDRRIRIGYVVETPVWKTSYRLLLSPPPDKKADATAKPASGGNLQGWAIVENQTDNDWNDVQLSLVSGRPISFVQDLYQPLYIPRPVVQPELFASLGPQTYEAGISERAKAAPFAAADAMEEERRAAPMAARQLRRGAMNKGAAADGANGMQLQQEAAQAIDASASVASVASATKVGELFQYTVGNVSLPRQKSAMIPIVTDPIEVEKLSIYNASVLPRNPLNGARVRNTTGKHLLQGPITVLDNGVYAGDARIDDVPIGQERLISYGVDLQVLVNTNANAQQTSLQSGKIVKGVLHLTYKDVLAQDYVAENKSDHDKTLLIEHPLHSGWKLVEPAKADETTDALYRFKGHVSPEKPSKLTVREERSRGETMAILPMDGGALVSFSSSGQISQPVKDALAKAMQLKGKMTDAQRQLQERQHQIQQITIEQTRIRENMKTVAANSDYYNRLLKKLDEQETKIEKLQSELQGLQKDADQQRQALEEYLGGLNVE